jgi:hypothetical protein
LADQERDEANIPPSVEGERGRDQPPLARGAVARERIVDAHGDRQEKEDELLAVKQHRSAQSVRLD